MATNGVTTERWTRSPSYRSDGRLRSPTSIPSKHSADPFPECGRSSSTQITFVRFCSACVSCWTAPWQPGADLGDAPEPTFEPAPRDVDRGDALEGISREAESLRRRLLEISPLDWGSAAIVGASEVDAHWICRHAVHDAMHHLMDVKRLQIALTTDR